MNHPYSSCHTHYAEMIQISELLLPRAKNTVAQAHPDSSMDAEGPHEDWNVTGDTEDLPEQLPPADLAMEIDTNSDSNAESPFFYEHHPSTPGTYGSGPTFMDDFDQDSHADKRSQKLYYPFASRPEWELASFLLRSNLSMASINTFLKLECVSVLRYLSYCWNN